MVRLEADPRHDELVRFYTRQARRGLLIVVGGLTFLVGVGLSFAHELDPGIVAGLATLLTIAATRHHTRAGLGPPRADPFEASAQAVGRGEKTLAEHESDVEKLLRRDDSPSVESPPDTRRPRSRPVWDRATPPRPADADRRPPPPPPPPPRAHGPGDHVYMLGDDRCVICQHRYDDDEGMGTRGERR